MKGTMKFFLILSVLFFTSCKDQKSEKSFNFKLPEDASIEQVELAMAKVKEEKPKLVVKSLSTDNYDEFKEYYFVFEEVELEGKKIEFNRSIWMDGEKFISGGGWGQNRIIKMDNIRISIMEGSSFFDQPEKIIIEYSKEAMSKSNIKPSLITFSSHKVENEVSIGLNRGDESARVKVQIKTEHLKLFK